MTTLHALHAADRRFVEDLGSRLGVDPEQALAELVDPAAQASVVRTTVRDGRFVSLSLREIGPSLHFAAAGGDLALPLGLLGGLVELDCTGLLLDTLELEGLAALQVLLCADNRLTHLEPGSAPHLRHLDCSGNRLMVLDLRLVASLVHLDCTGNQLSAFLFPAASRLQVLRCSRNELLVLDLGEQPDLRELACFRNPMLQLQLEHAPALRSLDCARCELGELDLSRCPALAVLDCSRNRLGAVEVAGCAGLARLDVSANYIERLDVSALSGLVTLRCRGNQIRDLRLGRHASLDELDCADNRLRTLDLSACPALAMLDCGGNDLDVLDLSENRQLCALDAHGNGLKELRTGGEGLVHLAIADNQLAAIDLRAHQELCRLAVDDGVDVLSTELQQQRLDALRHRSGLTTGGSDPSAMDAWELHAFASALRGPDAEARMLEVVRNARCDLGTALMIYWLNAPHYYLRYGSRDEVEPFEQPGWDLLAEIEQRVTNGFYQTREIWFDPRNDKQTRSVRGYDWTRPAREPRGVSQRQIPARMMAPSKPAP